MKNKTLNICKILSILYLLNISIGYAQENYDSLETVVVSDKESGISNSLVNVAFGKVPETDLLGAVSTVNIEELYKKSYSTDVWGDVVGLVGGFSGSIWGQAPLVLIDGLPRSYDHVSKHIHTSEIESISILKGASAVVLYGSKAAKGVILITTKRGRVSPLKVDVSANSGLYVTKAYPKYLDAASYMTLYNEACRNDGIAEKYSENEIYNTYSGTNPYRYPDIDFYSSEYLRKAFNKSDVNAEVYGGTEKTQYYTNFGFQYNDDLVKYGEHKNNNTKYFHLRSNVDMQLAKWLSASTDLGIAYGSQHTGRGDFWGEADNLRPNWVSPLIPISMFDPNNETLQTTVENSNHVVDGQFLLGGSSIVQENVFSEMLEGGYINYKDRLFQFKQTVNADLGSIIEGLSFSTTFGLDYESLYNEAFRYLYAVYEPTWTNMNGDDMIIDLTKYNDDKLYSNAEYIGEAWYTQTMTFSSQFNYIRSFAQHHKINAKLLGWGFQQQYSKDEGHDGSSYHRVSNLNLGLQVTYDYRNKYYLDFAGAMVHSAKLPEGNRQSLSPSITAGWRISDESFFKDNISFIDDLKLYASYAILNQDLDIEEYYMYKGFYSREGWFQWLDGKGGGSTTRSIRGDNPNLTFIQREEFSAGFAASFMEKSITLDANYFLQNTNGLLTRGASTIYPSYYEYGSDYYLPYINYNNDKRTGVDFNLNLHKEFGQVKWTLGFNGMFYTTEAVQRDEVHQDEYQYTEGKPLDAAWGLICEGFFEDQEDIALHATQTFGEVQPGDLKYKDVNEDGVVDGKDVVELGKYGFPFSYGVHLTLNWKNLTFFALGTGSSGATRFKGGTYYHVYGDRKYSEPVLGRWTEETSNTATYPRLTTTANTNNFRTSTFWMYDLSLFDLSKIQITYDLSDNFSESSYIKGLNVYVSAANLLTVSKERELLEINIASQPQYRFYNLGFKVQF